MNRDQLDEFFAKADDVLADWQGSADSMNSAPPPESYLRFLETVDAPGYEHRHLLEQVYGELDHVWRRNAAALRLEWRNLPIVPARSLVIASVA